MGVGGRKPEEFRSIFSPLWGQPGDTIKPRTISLTPAVRPADPHLPQPPAIDSVANRPHLGPGTGGWGPHFSGVNFLLPFSGGEHRDPFLERSWAEFIL